MTPALWYNHGVSERVMKVTEAVRAAIIDHAYGALPAECCGLLSGADGVITDCHPLRNVADRPESRYYATPEELFAAMRRIREARQKLLGIYHSHPRTPAYPSASDVEMAFYPEAAYFIISLEPQLDLRAYRIEGARVESLRVEVAPAADS
ncbi:MAG TPA: M67 family metallopeptidase [Blastocatellia bacterium]|nr:M67 family metallopeptidase [Blastocatellia bacterium]